MDVVWHDHKFAQFNLRKMRRNGSPHTFNHSAHLIQYDFAFNNLSKQVFSIMGDNGHKI